MKYAQSDFTIRKGDTAPQIVGHLTDGGGTPVNVTGATVVLRMRGLTVPAAPVSLAAAVLDGPSGKVGRAWQAADTAAPGYYAAWFNVTLTSGQVLSFPNDGWFIVDISD